MAISVGIKDGTGTDSEAKVAPTGSLDENAVWINIAGVSPGLSLPTQVGITGLRYEESLSLDNDLVTIDASVDGTTPKEFSITPHPTLDIVVSSISLFGSDGSIKLANFLGLNAALTNGCVLSQKSDNNEFTYKVIKTTNDFIKVATETVDFISQAAGDSFKATINFDPAIPIRTVGTFGPDLSSDDYIKFLVSDDLTSVVDLEVIVKGTLIEAGTL